MSNNTKLCFGVGLAILVVLLLLDLWADILAPFALALLLAYLTNPLVELLVKWHVPRTLAVSLLFLLLLCLWLLLLMLLVPLLERQLKYSLDHLPIALAWLQGKLIPWLQQYVATDDLDWHAVQAYVTNYWRDISSVFIAVIKSVSRSSAGLISHVINILLVPVVLFYVLRDWHSLWLSTEKMLPRKIAPQVKLLTSQCAEALSAFFRGQLLVMCALGIFYALCLSLINLQLGLLIGLLAGLLSIVPYLGFIIGISLALIASALQFYTLSHALVVVLVFILGNVLEGMVLTPWLVGNKVGLHPVMVIFAIMAGGEMFGFVGVLAALPIAAVLMVLLRYAYQRYLASEVYAQ